MAGPPKSPRTSHAVATNVRAPAGRPLIGRDADLDALDALAARGERLVAITGPAGVGKTALARQYAARRAASADARALAGGVWFVDLTDARELDDLCRAVAAVLEQSLAACRTSEQSTAQVGRALAARGPALIVLDNFEHLAAHASLVGRWLDAAPGASFVVTSRELLPLTGVTYELAPLGLPASAADARASDAVQLLLASARRVRRDYVLGDDEVDAVARIVTELDGLPLAIELAAARMTVLGPAALLERLARRFDTLGGPAARAGSARHATLRAALDSSWELLRPWERAALAQCAVFRGGFFAEDAEAVLDLRAWPDAPPALDVLQALRDKSLLRTFQPTDPPGRVRFGLFATIAEYAAARLDEGGGRASAEARHAERYAAVAEPWVRDLELGSRTEQLSRLAAERENLLAAVRRSIGSQPVSAAQARTALAALAGLDRLAWVQGPVHAHLELADAVHAAVAHVAMDPWMRARMLVVRASLRRRCGQLPAARADLDAALGVADGLADSSLRGRVLWARGHLELYEGRLDAAIATCEQACAIQSELGDPVHEGYALTALAAALKEAGRLDAARARQRRAIERFRDAGERALTGIALTDLGSAYLEMGRTLEARRCLDEALPLLRAAGRRSSEAAARTMLATVHHCDGELDAALGLYDSERTVALLAQLADPRFEAWHLSYRAITLQELGRLAEADAALERACTQLREIGDPRYRALFLGQLATVRADLARFDAALEALGAAEPLLASPQDPLRDTHALHRAYVELALARRPGADAAALRAAARGRITAVLGARPSAETTDKAAGAPASLARSLDARLAWQRLARVFRDELAAPPATPAADAPRRPALLVHAEGFWVRTPDGTRVELDRRRVLRQLLVALAEHRVRSPGRSLSPAQLFEVGWPGQRAQTASILNRIKVLMSTLRRLGLRAALLSRHGGYQLDPETPVEIVHDLPRDA